MIYDSPLHWLVSQAIDQTETPFPTRAERALPVEELRKLLSYDPETGVLTWRYREHARTEWNNRYAGTVAGTIHVKGQIQVRITVDGRPSYYNAHRIAWAIMTGEWPPHIVDHRNNNPAKNEWSNLRAATSSQNNCNRAVVPGRVPFKGVYWMPAKQKFAAQIKKDKKWEWLGLHLTAVDAARAYDARAIELHGQFARTNASMGLL